MGCCCEKCSGLLCCLQSGTTLMMVHALKFQADEFCHVPSLLSWVGRRERHVLLMRGRDQWTGLPAPRPTRINWARFLRE